MIKVNLEFAGRLSVSLSLILLYIWVGEWKFPARRETLASTNMFALYVESQWGVAWT